MLGASPYINLAFLKRTADNGPHIFNDTVHAIKELLQHAGFSVHISFNNIAPDALNIVVGAGMPGTPSLVDLRRVTRPDNTIIFNTEQLGSESVLITPEYLQLLADYVVWDYCNDNIAALRQRVSNEVTCHEFPIVPPHSFASQQMPLPTPRRLDFDFAFYGAVDIPRRISILQNLHEGGLRIKIIGGAFGPALATQLTDCSAVLNLHAYETGLFEISRCLRPMALGIPILSEDSIFPSCVDWAQSGIVFASKEDLVTQARRLTSDVSAQQTAMRHMQTFVANPRWAELARDILAQSLQQLRAR